MKQTDPKSMGVCDPAKAGGRHRLAYFWYFFNSPNGGEVG